MDLWNGGYWHQECPAFFVRILIVGAEKSMQNRGTADALTLPGAEMDFWRADSPAGRKQCSKREGRGTDARLGWLKVGILSWRPGRGLGLGKRSGGALAGPGPGKGFVSTWLWPKANPQRNFSQRNWFEALVTEGALRKWFSWERAKLFDRPGAENQQEA